MYRSNYVHTYYCYFYVAPGPVRNLNFARIPNDDSIEVQDYSVSWEVYKF